MNLLTDNLLTVAKSGEAQQAVSLPGLLDLCARDEIADWPMLRPHQYPAWHMFLTQLATLAQRAAEAEQIVGEAGWRDALRRLSPGFADDAPWRLIVDDWQMPAFLQPPCPAGREAEYKKTTSFADNIDTLITAKNHGLKANRMARASAEHWLYALVSLQTTDGFLGAGNYGIARMNGGFSSRPMLRCHAKGLGPGGQVMRDVRVLLRHWDSWYVRSFVGTDSNLQPLLWLLPWDGQDSLPLSSFHPLAIEVCRRVRLVCDQKKILARTASSNVSRVNAKAANGNVGCPWSPIDKSASKAFSLTAEGFSYRRLVHLLDASEYIQPLLARPESAENEGSQSLYLVAAGIARGKGKTDGVHQRRILLSPRTAKRLLMESGDEINSFVMRAKHFSEMAGMAAGKILRPALIQRIQGKADPNWKHPANEPRTAPWLRIFDAEIDRHFFPQLDASFLNETETTDAERNWSTFLEDVCVRIFQDACQALPVPHEAWILAEARAWNRLRTGIWKNLPLTRPDRSEVHSETTRSDRRPEGVHGSK